MTSNEDLEITINITVGEANTILKALQDMPFGKVVHIVNKFHAQAAPQIAAEEGKIRAEVIPAAKPDESKSD